MLVVKHKLLIFRVLKIPSELRMARDQIDSSIELPLFLGKPFCEKGPTYGKVLRVTLTRKDRREH